MAEPKEILRLNQLEAKDGVLRIENVELKAPSLIEEQKVTIEGTIQSVGNFFEVRKEQEAHDRSHVKYSIRELFISVGTRENNPLGYFIKGTLKINPKIADLQVNTFNKMGTKDLLNILKFNKFFFADKKENARIVENLMKFTFSAQKQIEAHDDLKGNVKEHFEVKNDSNIDLGFVLELPLYVGQPAKKFRVDINYNVRERGVDLWLESTELQEMLEKDAIEIIEAELKRVPESVLKIEQ